MTHLLWVGLGGFVGAILRYVTSSWVNSGAQSDFPWGTMIVNISGSFLLGAILGFTEQTTISFELKLALTVGLLGAFTTFSTFSIEALDLFQLGAYGRMLAYAIGSVIVGLIAAFVGLYVGRGFGG